MKPECEAILIECYRRQEAHKASQRPPAWQKYSAERWDDITEYGPLYACGEWFGDVPEFQRQRYRRAIDALAADGYLIRCGDRRLQSIQLTAEGEKLAEKLAGVAS